MFKTLRCFARGDERGWEAICVDLDIAIEADTFENAQAVLMESVSHYVRAALQEEPETRRQLLSRRSPFYVRAMWALRLTIHLLAPPSPIRSKMGTSDHRVSMQAGFDLPCPA